MHTHFFKLKRRSVAAAESERDVMANGNVANKGVVWLTTVFLPLAIGCGTISYWIYCVGVQQTGMSKDIETNCAAVKWIEENGTKISRGGQLTRAEIQVKLNGIDMRVSEMQADIKDVKKQLESRDANENRIQAEILRKLDKLVND